jgi:perosamine synthetase
MDVSKILILENADVKTALEKIDMAATGVIFVIDDAGKMKGILSDGDIRRALINNYTLFSKVKEIMNTDFVYASINSSNSEIISKLNSKIKILPLLDEKLRVIDYSSIKKLRSIPIAFPSLTGNELAYVTDCLNQNWISSQGKYVKEFETLFSKYHLDFYSLAVSNGTVALHLALVALGIGEGDEVIVPNLTFAASVNAIIYTGAVPVVSEIDAETWNIDVKAAAELISDKTKAIMPVHLYGCPCEMDEVVLFAKKNNLLIIEDCAEALGSYYKNKPVGVFGDASTFSFFGNKTITTGEGGMILFKNKNIAERAEVLRDHGMNKSKRYWHDEVGYNYRLTNIQAAIGVAQFEQLNLFVNKKTQIASKYTDCLKKYTYFQTPTQNKDIKNSYWLYTFLILKNAPFTRDDFAKYLNENQIETRPVFYTIDEMPPYKKFIKSKNLTNSVYVSKNGISLPSSVMLLDEEVEHICNVIDDFISTFDKI